MELKLPLSIGLVRCVVADTADTSPSVPVGIPLIEGMPTKAMSLGRLLCRARIASHRVLSMRDNFKVFPDINAGSVAAEVVENEAIGHGAYEMAERPVIGEERSPSVLKAAIALCVEACRPDHAAIGAAWIDVRPEADDGIERAVLVACKMAGHRVTSGVMGRAAGTAAPLHFTSNSSLAGGW